MSTNLQATSTCGIFGATGILHGHPITKYVHVGPGRHTQNGLDNRGGSLVLTLACMQMQLVPFRRKSGRQRQCRALVYELYDTLHECLTGRTHGVVEVEAMVFGL